MKSKILSMLNLKYVLCAVSMLMLPSCSPPFHKVNVPGIINSWPSGYFSEPIVAPNKKKEVIIKTVSFLEENNRLYWGKLNDGEKDEYFRLFDKVTNEIENFGVALIGIEDDWLKHKLKLKSKFKNVTSHGEALGIITRLTFFLKEGHAMIIPERMIMGNNMKVGAPHLSFTYLGLNPLGAWITPCEGNKLIISKVTDKKSPYNWTIGDEIVALNGIPWNEWRHPLEESSLPILGSLGANESARSVNWQKSIMRNFHLFQNITVKRVNSNKLEVIPVQKTQFSKNDNYLESPFPIDYIKGTEVGKKNRAFKGGIIAGQQIGYIKIDFFDHQISKIETWNPEETQFYKDFEKAIDTMMDTKGIILDLRGLAGGMHQVSYGGLKLLVENKEKVQFYDVYEKMGKGNLQRALRLERPFLSQNPDTFYKGKIIVLTNSECVSGGDIFTAIASTMGNILVLGMDNNGSFAGHEKDKFIKEGSLDILLINPEYIWLRHDTQIADIRKSFIDIYVEYKKEDLINGRDTLLMEAIKRITLTTKQIQQ
jgi:hypothetical protein